METKEGYKDNLNIVKSSINVEGSGEEILGIRSTKDGKMLVVSTTKNMEALNKIHEAIRKDGNDIRMTKKTDSEERLIPIHIRGIDADTTQEELVSAIENQIGPSKDKKYKVGVLRPNTNETQAATVSIGRKENSWVTENKSGIICPVERRLKIKRCPRCWAFDHKQASCQSTRDLTKSCYKCGSSNHKVK